MNSLMDKDSNCESRFKMEELTLHHVEGLFAVWHGGPIKTPLNADAAENLSVSRWGSIGAPALGLKAVIELDTTAEGGRETERCECVG